MAPAFREHGVDDIICVSVNDAFVMNEWKDEQKADELAFLPDGNGDFTRGMGMLVGKEDLGFGERSWRYSMLVRDGKIEKMFIEPDVPGDPFEVSDADTMLAYLAPEAAKPLDVTVFTREGCPFCVRAKGVLHDAGIDFAHKLMNGVLKYQSDMDNLISRHAPEWPLDQMAVIDRNILRISIYEFLIDSETPVKVAINEAVEMAKVYGSDSAPRFVNGVLGSLAEQLSQLRQQIEIESEPI